MPGHRPSRARRAIVGFGVPLALLAVGQEPSPEAAPPSLATLRSLVDGFAHAIETNNRKLALWHVHPASPRKSEIGAALQDQLASHFERARTSRIERLADGEPADGIVSARVHQEFVRVAGLKFMRGTRRSIYRFEEIRGSWRIWDIGREDVPAGPVFAAGRSE